MSASSQEQPKQLHPKSIAAPALQEAHGRRPAAAPVQDPAAAAAQALAVNSARSAASRLAANGGKPDQAGAGPALRAWVRPAALAGGVSLALALGWIGGALLVPPQAAAVPDWSRALISEMRRGQDDMAALRGEVASLQASLATLVQDVSRSGTEAATRQSAVEAKTALQVERANQDLSARLVRLGEAVERIERAGQDNLQLAAIVDRLDRIEKRVAEPEQKADSPIVAVKVAEPERKPEAPVAVARAPEPERKTDTPAPSAKSGEPEPTQTASLGEAKVDVKNLPLDGWTLRDVYDGLALVEGKNRRLYEVAPGQVLPGVGLVEKIERRGRNWVVVTPKGLIGGMTGRWW